MGRGRQKAKQTKVARELKYSSYEPNYRALEQELASGKGRNGGVATETTEERDPLDPLADWVDDDR